MLCKHVPVGVCVAQDLFGDDINQSRADLQAALEDKLRLEETHTREREALLRDLQAFQVCAACRGGGGPGEVISDLWSC